MEPLLGSHIIQTRQMPSTNRVEVTLESKLESVDRAEELASEFARSAGFHEDDQFRIGMAVRESMVNAVHHGNQYDPQKKACLCMELEARKLVVTVTDQGPGFDLSLVPDPRAEENLLKQSGRGVFLIRTLMDEVSVRRLLPAGTEIRMVKYPSPSNGKED